MFKKKVKGFFKDLFKKKSDTVKVKKDGPKLVPRNKDQKIIKKKLDKKNEVLKKRKDKQKNLKENSTNNKTKKLSNKAKTVIGTGLALTGGAVANKYFSDDAGSVPKKKGGNPGTGNEIINKKKKFGMGQVDSLSKGKARQGPPKPVAKAPIKKKKSKSNISNSSSYDADFTKKGLEKRGLNPKGRMSKENMAKTTAAKDKKIAKGMDFGQKKKKVKAPMYESSGTMGGVKKTKYASKGMKTSKYYASGGVVFSGR